MRTLLGFVGTLAGLAATLAIVMFVLIPTFATLTLSIGGVFLGIILLLVIMLVAGVGLVCFFSLFPKRRVTGVIEKIDKKDDETEFTVNADGEKRSFSLSSCPFKVDERVEIDVQWLMWTLKTGKETIYFWSNFQLYSSR